MPPRIHMHGMDVCMNSATSWPSVLLNRRRAVVWNVSTVLSPHACPFFRSVSVQTIGCQSGASISRAPALSNSIAVAAGLVDVEEEGLLNGVLVRAGLDVDAVLEADVGGAQHLVLRIDRPRRVMEASVRAVVIVR